jgi:hypothetical protein
VVASWNVLNACLSLQFPQHSHASLSLRCRMCAYAHTWPMLTRHPPMPHTPGMRDVVHGPCRVVLGSRWPSDVICWVRSLMGSHRTCHTCR